MENNTYADALIDSAAEALRLSRKDAHQRSTREERVTHTARYLAFVEAWAMFTGGQPDDGEELAETRLAEREA